ncbi:hypothetical protein BDR03DRAFT_1014624 [Suillus americanus]|nr:hypothetical protein BDR03DRAFT_1014624 [Suillus americanus]
MWQNKLSVTLLGDIPDSSRSAGWTLMHGFFACMGDLCSTSMFVHEESIEMPVITKADIKDRSKSDLLSKCIAILQLVWFFIQLMARYTQNLPVTLLEIDTLDIAAVTCISYGLWLKKLKDIEHSYVVHWNSEVTAPPPGNSLANKYY